MAAVVSQRSPLVIFSLSHIKVEKNGRTRSGICLHILTEICGAAIGIPHRARQYSIVVEYLSLKHQQFRPGCLQYSEPCVCVSKCMVG